LTHEPSSPAYFEPNQGQADGSAAFVARGPGYTALLQQSGATAYYFSSGTQDAPETIRMELRGAKATVEAVGEQQLSSVTHYYFGHELQKWRPGIPHYRVVRARQVYPGIDMLWQSEETGLEYEFVVDAGANPRLIRLRFSGTRHIRIDQAGNLVAEAGGGRFCHRRPVAWQEISGRRVPVDARFRVESGTAGFRLGRYDRRQKLWIDPVLTYASYLGGAGYDAGYAIAVDGSGQMYIAGTTASASFSSQNSGLRASRDAFVTKFGANGAIVYTTILASSADDSGQAIAVDSAGNVYVAGTTEGSDFPATTGAWQSVSGGGEDGFAAKLDSYGNLVYASYIGGAGNDAATGIATDRTGNAYISGYTSSAGFPTTPGAPQVNYRGGPYDAFLVKLNAAGSAAVFATLLGGSGNDQAQAVALDPAGNACIAGYTDSHDLAVQAPVQASLGGEGDAMIACLNAAGTAWMSVSYLGGSGVDQAYALAIDGAGNLYVAGTTFSEDFPTTPSAFQPSPAGGYDAFVVKLGPCGSSLVYATLLGGSGSDAATALAPGSTGDVWLGGYTASFDFPVVGSWQSSNHGSFDGFIAHLSANGSILLAASYLGGAQQDQIWGIALSSTGMVLATGSTGSADFPVTPGAAEPGAAGGFDAFLAQIDPPLTGYSISGQVTVSGIAGLAGVNLVLSGSASGATSTDVSGNYAFNGLISGGSYTITPSASGYSFSPPSQAFNGLGANQTAGFTAACGLAVNPSAVFLDSTSQSAPPIYVAAESPACLWVASADAEFISITSGTNGIGNGAITLSVPANTTGADQTGTLSVDGQAVSVTQRGTPVTFTDVSNPSDYYFDAANTMYQRGISNGCASTPLLYCPADTNTRGQMAKFMVIALVGAGFSYSPTPYFTDVPNTDPFFSYIQKLYELGVTNGCAAAPSRKFCPDDSVTRGQTAAFIIRARYASIPFSVPATPYFTDVPPTDPFFSYIQKMAELGVTNGCTPTMYCPGETLLREQMSVFIVRGLLNQLLPASTPILASASPNSAAAGTPITVTITGFATHFASGTSQVMTVPGISASNLVVNSPTSLTVQLLAAPGAAPDPNPSPIVVVTGSEEAGLPGGFTVE